MKLFIGLGNPGTQYAKTRHNAGVWWIEALAAQERLNFKLEKAFCAHLAKSNHQNHPFFAAIPTVYMNESGRAVQAIKKFFNLAAQEICIIHDELDLPPGSLRLKQGGGHGGHNGLRDIIEKIGSPDFYRLRIGIGHPGHKDLVTPYVLNAPSLHDRALIDEAINNSLHHFEDLLAGNTGPLMQALNQKR